MATGTETTFQVSGMTCQSCVRHINGALGSLEGVQDVRVSLGNGQVVVRHDMSKIPVGILIEALSDAGYTSRVAS